MEEFPVSKLIGAWCSLIRVRGKRVVKGKWTEEKEARSQMTGWLFNLAGLYFFFVPGIPMKNRERNDDRCARWYTEERTVEKRGNPCACIYMYMYSIYILDALSARNAATDLHQGNHDDTSYGKSLEWDTDIQGFGRYIYVHTGSIGRAFLYSIALHRDGTHRFLMGCKNQDWLN